MTTTMTSQTYWQTSLAQILKSKKVRREGLPCRVCDAYGQGHQCEGQSTKQQTLCTRHGHRHPVLAERPPLRGDEQCQADGDGDVERITDLDESVERDLALAGKSRCAVYIGIGESHDEQDRGYEVEYVQKSGHAATSAGRRGGRSIDGRGLLVKGESGSHEEGLADRLQGRTRRCDARYK